MPSIHSVPPMRTDRPGVCSGRVRGGLRVGVLAVAALGLLGLPVRAQDPQWSANLVIQPYPSPFLSDWERNPQIAQLTVFYTGQDPADFRVELVIESARRGPIGRAVSGTYPVPFGPHTQLLTNPEVVDWASMDYEDQAAELARRTGVLPEGEYEACARILDLQGQLRAEACAPFTIVLPEPPELIAPANSGAVTMEQPVFQWTPIQIPPELGLTYRVRIVERLQGQTPQTALQANIPTHEAEVADVPLLVYPLDALPLETGHEYVWQVEALDALGRPITAGGRSSEIWVFRYGEEEEAPGVVTGVLPDTLTLVPGVARLRGLASADVREHDYGYTIDGPLTLEIFGPFSATADVEADALQVTRSSLEDPAVPPDFPGGRLTGRLDPDAVPESNTGPFVELTDVMFNPNMYLTLGGRLALPGAEEVEMDGRASVTHNGVFGTLRVASPTDTLAALGTDPVRLLVRRTVASLPEGTVKLQGELELFGRAIGCRSVEGTVSAAGVLSGTVLCAPSGVIRPVSGVDRFHLELASVSGSLEGEVTADRLGHDLVAPGALRIDGTVTGEGGSAGGSSCSVLLDVGLVNGDLSESGVRSRCAGTDGLAVLDWLAFRLSTVGLDRFTYGPGAGFDIALSLDMDPLVATAPGLDLPVLQGVEVTADGFAIPALDEATSLSGRVGGFGLGITRVTLSPFTLGWEAWDAGSAAGFDFGLAVTVRMPELGSTAPACLAVPLGAATGRLAEGRLRVELTGRSYGAGECVIPLGPGSGLDVETLGGALDVALTPEPRLETLPAVTGAVDLPDFFTCPAGTAARMPLAGDTVGLGPRGRLDGTATGLSPPCPIELAALAVDVTDAELQLGADDEGAQTATLSGGASATFAAGDSVSGSGTIAIDLVAGRMTDGELVFDGPFRLDLPRDDPVFSFRIGRARLDTTGLHIDGRHALILPGGGTIGTTFDALTLNPLTLQVSSGRVLFDSPFAFEAAVDDAGDLDWAVVAVGAEPTVTSGFRVDLPAAIALGADGFTAEGTGIAHLRYGGRDLDSLEAGFTPDFAMTLSPFGVDAGRMDLNREGVRIAYVDPLGFHPSFAYFGVAVLPERLGLPNPDVAYLELRDGPDGPLRVETETTPDGIRIHTPTGSRVPLVFPALRLGRATAPRVEVPVDLTLDELGEGVVAGRLEAAIPAAVADAFDLSAAGVPFAVDSLAYEPGSAYRFTLSGLLALFGEQLGVPGDVVLTLDGTGRLTGDVFFRTDQRVPMVPGSDRMTLAVDSVSGGFDAALLDGGPYGFQLDAMGAIELATEAPYRVETTVRASETGVTVPRIEGGADAGRIDLGELGLGVRNARVEYLAFSDAAGWDFELLFDVHFDFPGLGGLTLPPLEAVSLRPDGFRIPEYDVPELRADPFELGGFGLTPLAFRMDSVHYDWFAGAEPADWGFGFDLALSLAGLPETTPAALRAVTLSVLDAGYSDGTLTGDIEPRILGTPIEMPVGGDGGPGVLIDRLAGTLGELADGLVYDPGAGGLDLGAGGPHAGSPGDWPGPRSERAGPDRAGAAALALQEPLTLTLGGAFVLPEAMQCAAAPGDTVALGDAELTLSSEGLISGRVADFAPPCPLVLGPLALEVTTSELIFDISSAGQEVELDLDGALELPAPSAGDTVSAAGAIGVDLVRLRVLRGRIAVSEPFRWDLPVDDPLVRLTVNEGLLDPSGLHLTGTGALALAGGSSVGVTFSDLTLALPDFGISAGSASFDAAFGFRVGIGSDGLTWETVDPSASTPAGNGFRMSLPAGVTLSAEGLRVDGTGSAALDFADSTFAALSVEFRDAFAVGFDPVGVSAGRADFNTDEGLVAWVDADGFHPGDLFAIADLPERIGLPTEDVAYLVVADETGDLVETAPALDGSGMALRTADGDSVQLVIPALATDGTAPRINVTLEVVVNPGDFDFVSGSVQAAPGGGASYLLSLADLGIPLDVTGIAYEDTGSGYGLRLDADLGLPDALGGLDVAFRDVTIDASGLSGTAEVGSYSDAYDPGVAPEASTNLGTDVDLELYGVRATFSGRSATIDLAAAVKTALFAPESGEPAPLFFTAGVGPGGSVSASIDPPASALPVWLAEFEPMPVDGSPAIALDVAGSELDLTLSGRLTVPAISDGFAISIAGLTVGTGGIDVPDVSISTGDEPQSFELFAATFTLEDRPPEPAIGLSYGSGVLTATMTGSLEFLENTATFQGLSVGSDGSIAIAEANLLEDPIAIVDGVVDLTQLAIRDSRLEVTTGVTLPEPLGDGGAQEGTFSIGPDGSVEGSALIRIISEEPVALDGDDTEYGLGVATFDPRYAAIDFDFADLSRSAVEVVADVYLQEREANRIFLGETDGGTIRPGFRLTFDGATEWRNFGLAGDGFEFDLEVLRLGVNEITAPATGEGFAIAMGGDLGFNLGESFESTVGFTGFTLGAGGDVDFGSITEGSITVAEVMTLELSDFGYSRTDTVLSLSDVSLSADGTGATAAGKDVSVASYVTFGGEINVHEVFSGGVERFLLYRQATAGGDTTTHMVIDNATLSMMSEVIEVTASMEYHERDPGFELMFVASGTVMEREVDVVGQLAKGDSVRIGIFFAADVELQIGPVTIQRIGGGFFYHPTESAINAVKTAVDMEPWCPSGSPELEGTPYEGTSGCPDPGDWAVMVFGAATIIQEGTIDGSVLLTVTQTYFQVDAEVVVLSQEGKLEGEAHLTVGFRDGFAEGLFALDVLYDPVVTGRATIEFYAYGGDTWGIIGKVRLKVVANILRANANVFIGPPGFMADLSVDTGFDIWIIKVETGFKTIVWFYKGDGGIGGAEWGAYLEVYVKAQVLRIASVKGTLRGALIIGDPTIIYAAAELRISLLKVSWSGSLWMKFSTDGVSGGFGKDPALEDILDRATRVRDEMEEARERAEEAISEAQMAAALVGPTEEELTAAYRAIGQLTGSGASWVLAWAVAAEETYAEQPGQEAYLDWYTGVLLREGAPADSTRPYAYTDSLRTLMRELDARGEEVSARIAELQVLVENVPGSDAPYDGRDTVYRGPATLDHDWDSWEDGFSTTVDTAADGLVRKTATGQPGFQIDRSEAAAMESDLGAYRDETETLLAQVRTQVNAVETAVGELRSALTGAGEGSLLSYARLHSRARSLSEAAFVHQGAQIAERADWYTEARGELERRESTIERIIEDKTDALTAFEGDVLTDGSRANLMRLINSRLSTFDVIMRTDTTAEGTYRSQFREELLRLEPAQQAQTIVQEADTSGILLWYGLARSGTEAISRSARRTLAGLDTMQMERLGRINASHAQLSASFDRLYRGQANLTAVAYDLYDRYLWWSADTVVDTRLVLPDDPFLREIRDRKSQLRTALQVPRLTQLGVTVHNHDYYARQVFRWDGWHASAGIVDAGVDTGLFDSSGTGFTIGTGGSGFGEGITLGGTGGTGGAGEGGGTGGIYEYSYYRTEATGTGILGTSGELREALDREGRLPFRSNGGVGQLTGYEFGGPLYGLTASGEATSNAREESRSFIGRVRGGAGFTGFGRSEYTVRFGRGESITTGERPTDDSPPTQPVINFPGRTTLRNDPEHPVARTHAFTSDMMEPFRVSWVSYDFETGVSAYEYKLGRTLDGGEILDYTGLGGRQWLDINLERLGVTSPPDTLFIAIRARNGDGLWSGARHARMVLDTVPPDWITPGGGLARGEEEWPDDFEPAATLDACPVPDPGYPDQPTTSGTTTWSTGITSTTSLGGTWSGSLSPSLSSSMSLSAGLETELTPTIDGLGTLPAGGEPPTRKFSRGEASDNYGGSGMQAYYWRVDTIPATAFQFEGWNRAPAFEEPDETTAFEEWAERSGRDTPGEDEDPINIVTVTGEPLNYEDEFYISVVAVDNANNASEISTQGPFTVPDRTRASAPEFCAGPAADSDRLKVELDRVAYDPESGVAGYQYRVKRGDTVIRPWPDGATIDWEGAGSSGTTFTTEPLGLEDGRRYLVSVRAVNGHGSSGNANRSGPVLVDHSPPPYRPWVSVDPGRFSGADYVELSFWVWDDPHSGIGSVQMAVGSSERRADIVNWRDVPDNARNGVYKRWVETPGVESGETYWVQVRSVNGAGLVTRIYRTSYTVP